MHRAARITLDISHIQGVLIPGSQHSENMNQIETQLSQYGETATRAEGQGIL